MKTSFRDRLGEAGSRRRHAADGAGSRPPPIGPRRWQGRLGMLLLAVVVLVLALRDGPPEEGRAAPQNRPSTFPRPRRAPDVPALPVPWEEPAAGCPEGCAEPPPGCVIKGNVSIKTGERIYHVPGQAFYEKAKISPEYGERWFCTEDEARENGWRKAFR